MFDNKDLDIHQKNQHSCAKPQLAENCVFHSNIEDNTEVIKYIFLLYRPDPVFTSFTLPEYLL